MGKKKTKNNQDIREAKKAAVLGAERKNRLPLILVICAVLIGGAGVYIAINGTGSDSVSSEANLAPGPKGDQVVYQVSEFADGRARHYEFKHKDMTIRYFILKSSDGVIRAAFDACDVCWPAGKGYYQDGDVMICRNCGRRFASVLVNEVKGGCNPAPLKRSVQGEQLILKVQDIIEGSQYFNFSGKV
jgi:uncharacterized membrane protein